MIRPGIPGSGRLAGALVLAAVMAACSPATTLPPATTAPGASVAPSPSPVPTGTPAASVAPSGSPATALTKVRHYWCKTLAEATAMIGEDGFVVGAVTSDPSGTTPIPDTWVVYSQDPQPDRQAAPGTAVSLVMVDRQTPKGAQACE